MPNTISAGLKRDIIIESALTAFTEAIAPLALFSTQFDDLSLQGTDIVQVPYYPLETAASQDFNGTYTFDASDTSVRPVTIDKRKYQSLSYTSSEFRRQPNFDPVKLGQMKGQKLAEDVLADIWSIITAANYGAAGFTGAASTFDVDDVIDKEAALNALNWPRQNRGVIVGPTYIAELKKDINTDGGAATFARDANGEMSTFPSMHGFSFSDTNLIPANGENLVGMFVYPSAILVGFSPIEPTPEVRQNLTRYDKAKNEAGMTIEYREWGVPGTDTTNAVLEVNYGYAVGEAAAISRMVSA
jgi:hypothetical protein